MQEIDRIIGPLEAAAGLEPGAIRVIPWIESARAVMSAQQMALASPRVVAIAFGAEDYTNDMGVQRTDDGEEVYVPRSMTAIAARAAGVASLDSPYVAFRNPEGTGEETLRRRGRLGYNGKFAIHPSQIEAINRTFSPHPDDVAYARQVVAAWDEAEAAGRGSLALDGKMVDVPVVKRAQNLLALVDAIAQAGG